MMVCEQHKPIQYSHKIFFSSVCDSFLIAVSLIKKKIWKRKMRVDFSKKEGKTVFTAGRNPQQSTLNNCLSTSCLTKSQSMLLRALSKYSLKHWQAGDIEYLPRQPVPGFDHPPRRERLPNFQPECVLVQLWTIPMCFQSYGKKTESWMQEIWM